MPEHDAPTFGSEAHSSSDEPTRASGEPPGAPASLTDTTQSMPARIGPYRILRLLGEGGMGVVYEAEQASPRRTVALKVIRAHSPVAKRFSFDQEYIGHMLAKAAKAVIEQYACHERCDAARLSHRPD